MMLPTIGLIIIALSSIYIIFQQRVDNLVYSHVIKMRLFHDINASRKTHNLRPLQLVPWFNKMYLITNLRSKQIAKSYTKMTKKDNQDMKATDKMIHNNNTSHRMIDELCNKYDCHITPSENADDIVFGNLYVNDGGRKFSYVNKTAKDIADNSIIEMMDFDNDENNGHRKTILNKRETKVAIGVYFNRDIPQSDDRSLAKVDGGIVEEFY